MHQLVVLPVQLGADLLVQGGPGVESFLPFLSIRALHVLQQPVEIAFFTAKVGDRQGAVLLVLLAQVPFPDHVGDDPFIRGLEPRIDEPKHLLPELRLELRPEGTGGQGLLVRLPEGDQRRVLGPEPLHLAVVIGVGGVDGVAYGAEHGHGGPLFLRILQSEEGASSLLVAGGALEFLDGLPIGGFQRLHIRPHIGHVPKIYHFHAFSSRCSYRMIV